MWNQRAIHGSLRASRSRFSQRCISSSRDFSLPAEAISPAASLERSGRRLRAMGGSMMMGGDQHKVWVWGCGGGAGWAISRGVGGGVGVWAGMGDGWMAEPEP